MLSSNASRGKLHRPWPGSQDSGDRRKKESGEQTKRRLGLDGREDIHADSQDWGCPPSKPERTTDTSKRQPALTPNSDGVIWRLRGLVPCKTIQPPGRLKVPSILVRKGRRGNNPIATIKVFKHNGKIQVKGLAAYLKATNSVELTDAGMREIALFSYLQEKDMAHLEKLCSVSEAQSKALSMYYVMKVVKADPFFTLLNAEKSFLHELLSQKQSTVELVTQDQEQRGLSDLCKAVSTAIKFIGDYRAKRNEMIMEIDPGSLLSDEHKAESSDETKLFANAEKG